MRGGCVAPQDAQDTARAVRGDLGVAVAVVVQGSTTLGTPDTALGCTEPGLAAELRRAQDGSWAAPVPKATVLQREDKNGSTEGRQERQKDAILLGTAVAGSSRGWSARGSPVPSKGVKQSLCRGHG